MGDGSGCPHGTLTEMKTGAYPGRSSYFKKIHEFRGLDMKEDDDFLDLQQELFMERKKKFGQREDGATGPVTPIKYVPVDTGEECVGG